MFLTLLFHAWLALVSAYLLWGRGKQPKFIYHTIAYWLGLIGSLLAQTLK